MEIFNKISIMLGLRRKMTLVIGTNREKLLKYIIARYDVLGSPNCTIHTNINNYIIERKVASLTEADILHAIETYDEIVFYSTIKNVNSIMESNAYKQNKNKIECVCYN